MVETDSPSRLVVEDLVKCFPSVRALDGVSLAFAAGEVHGIVGENGAGKSTLVRVIAGLETPSGGRVLFNGQAVRHAGPAQAMRLGISMVHQELNLVDELTVADNIVLGRELTAGPFIRRGATEALAADLLGRIGCAIDPAAKVRDLSIAERQMVEIAKALSLNASVLILDEPTAVLSGPEVERLFELIGRLRAGGVSVLYISHILPEVLRICDRITVMRDGRVVRTLRRAEAGDGPSAEALLGSLMVGRPMGDHFPPRRPHGTETVLAVRGLSAGPRVREVMKTFLVQHKQIDAVWAQDDDMAEGAEQAIKEAGRQKEMWMLGGAGKKTIIKRVMDKDPMYPADITYPPAMIAAGIHVAVYKPGGTTFEQMSEKMPKHLSVPMEQIKGDAKHIKLDVDLVTPENAEKYYFPESVF